MGRIFSKATRPLRNFNIESRVDRVLDREKPLTAPRHPTNIKIEDHMKRETKSAEEKDQKLSEYLQHVRVLSKDGPQGSTTEPNTKQTLPQFRGIVDDFEYGIMDPVNIPIGKTSMRFALEFIANHQSDPQHWSAEHISREYRIDLEQVQKILSYFRAFEVFIPKRADPEPRKFLGGKVKLLPSKPQGS